MEPKLLNSIISIFKVNVRILFFAMKIKQQLIKNLDVAKASEIDQISAKFLKDDAPVIAIHHANIISASIKLDTFPSKCNVAKIKAFFKKGIKTETENYRPIFGPPALARRVGSLVFSETQHGVRDPCLIVCDRAGFF